MAGSPSQNHLGRLGNRLGNRPNLAAVARRGAIGAIEAGQGSARLILVKWLRSRHKLDWCGAMPKVFEHCDALGPAKVIHVHEPGMGLKFSGIPENVATAIDRWINESAG